MNEQVSRPGSIALASVVIGGVLIAILPQHAMSIVRLVILTIAAATGLYALGINAPATWWRSPFDRRRSRSSGAGEPDEVTRIRTDLSRWRRRIGAGPPVPSAVLRRLRPLIATTLEREGVDPAAVGSAAAGRVLSPLSRAILASEALGRPGWLDLAPPNRRAVAGAVHDVLDELEELAAGRDRCRPGTREPLAT